MKFTRMRNLIVPLVAIFLAACASASGSAIVTGTTRTPLDPNQVKLYLTKPANYDVIGIVSASSDSGWTEQESVDYAIQELKEQAAQLGSNGVLLETVDSVTSGFVMSGNVAFPITAESLSGKAIYVRE